MTSNIGASYLLEEIQENGEISPETEHLVIRELTKYFRPEFLNRLDETVVFRPLTKENMVDITELILENVNSRLAERELSIFLTESAKNYVVEHGYDPIYGARPLKRYIQKTVETLAAKLILSDQVSGGDTIVIDVVADELVAKRK